MHELDKVVWREGMHVAPQHFQAEARYFENRLRYAAVFARPGAYGFLPHDAPGGAYSENSGFEICPTALAGGVVDLTHACGFFPDGLPFDIPSVDQPPPKLDLGRDARDWSSPVTISLAIPRYDPEGANCALADLVRQEPRRANERFRFSEVSSELPDANSGMASRQVPLGRKNIRLIADEPHSNMISLPLARVVLTGSGQLRAERRFVPPCLQIGASGLLRSYAVGLLNLLTDKAQSLVTPSRNRISRALSVPLLQTILPSTAELRHVCANPSLHPEELYWRLVKLAGALCTFVKDSEPRSLPAYDHERLGACFHSLAQHIRFHLNAVLPVNVMEIPLEPAGQGFFEASIPRECLGKCRWVFGIYSRVGECALVSLTQRSVKIASASGVRDAQALATGGVVLRHVNVPPAAIDPKDLHQYFVMDLDDPASEAWREQIRSDRSVGVYVPPLLPDPQLDLQIILQTGSSV